MTTYRVGELASMAGITVRTLHHYEAIGLLAPSARTATGYRVYDDDSVDRLRAILTYRELGLGLEEVATVVNDQAQMQDALTTARNRLLNRIDHLKTIVESLNQTLDGSNERNIMTAEDKLSVFGDFDPAEHAEEAAERWGGTPEYSESLRRTNSYTKQDWVAINAEMDDIYRRLLALKNSGFPADSPNVGALVAEHRAHISRWYYECTPQIHQGLGLMYVSDPRFRKNIDKSGEGLAVYLSDAIAAAYR